VKKGITLRNMALTIGYTGRKSLRLPDRSSFLSCTPEGSAREGPTNHHTFVGWKDSRWLSPMGYYRSEPHGPSAGTSAWAGDDVRTDGASMVTVVHPGAGTSPYTRG